MSAKTKSTAEHAQALIGTGLYSVREASRLSGVSSPKIRRWLFGYQSRRQGNVVQHSPVWQGQLSEEGLLGVGFLDLLEIRFVDAFQSYGVSLQSIRSASDFARKMFNSSHPFTLKKFQTDGQTIFAELLEQGAAEDDAALIDLVKRQLTFKQVIQPSLRGIVYGETGEAQAWHPNNSRSIILDPDRSFGKPIDERSGVPTEVIYSAYQTGEPVQMISRLYQIEPRAVKAAVEFETSLREREVLH